MSRDPSNEMQIRHDYSSYLPIRVLHMRVHTYSLTSGFGPKDAITPIVASFTNLSFSWTSVTRLSRCIDDSMLVQQRRLLRADRLVV